MIATQYSTASEAIGCRHSIITRQTSGLRTLSKVELLICWLAVSNLEATTAFPTCKFAKLDSPIQQLNLIPNDSSALPL